MSRAQSLLAGAMIVGAVAGLLGACTDSPVVLANVPSDDAGAPTNVPVRCVTLNDCPHDMYCEKDTCGAPAGTCELYPTDCDNTEAPECGCDGITYFNKCIRQSNGVAASTTNECSALTAVTCDGDEDASGCPTGALCARTAGLDTGPTCPHDSFGICWFLPPTCPTTGSNEDNLWDDCDPTGPRCDSTCDAIRSGGVFRRALECPSGDAGGLTHP